MNTKETVIFLNKKRIRLHGILQKTTDPRPKPVAIMILSPGIKNRVAPHRLYVKMSERFNALGFNVFRFDPEGIGDSEGEIIEFEVSEVLSSVENGRFVESTIAAMDFMEREYGVRRFILSGLCGGAITGLITAAQDDRVVSLLGLGIPAVLSSLKRRDPYKYISKGELEGKRQHYLRQMFKPEKWLRFLTFKVDYRMILKSLLMFIKPSSNSKNERENTAIGTNSAPSNLNPLFRQSMFDFLGSSRDMCLIFSGQDRLYWEFEEKFKTVYLQEFNKYADNCEISVVPNANHIFSSPEWEETMMETACNWLNRKYG